MPAETDALANLTVADLRAVIREELASDRIAVVNNLRSSTQETIERLRQPEADPGPVVLDWSTLTEDQLRCIAESESSLSVRLPDGVSEADLCAYIEHITPSNR